MSLQDRLHAFRTEFEAGRLAFKPSREILDAMHRATAELIAGGQAGRALKAGDRAPDFSLEDPEGKDRQPRDLLAKGPLVRFILSRRLVPLLQHGIAGARGRAARVSFARRRARRALAQTAPNSRRSERENKLSFPILSDAKSEVAAAFGIRFALPDYLIAVYKGFKNDLPTTNDDPSWVLPMPARYVIGQDGIIAYAEVNPDYTRRPDPSELLPVLDRLRLGTAA